MEEAERMLERVRESSSLPGRESSFSEEREAEFMRRLGIAETELSKYGEQYNNAKTLDEKQEVARRIDEVLGFLTGEMPFGMTKESIMASPYYEEGNEDSKGFYDPKDKSMTLNIEENEGYKDYLNS
ncbi:MAG: hypothetical protein LBE56_12490 [Tannerella sp.]|nr:hypothetical protein [Tannerella sp.]